MINNLEQVNFYVVKTDMQIKEKIIDDKVIIELSGKILGGDQVTMFHGLLHQKLDLNKKNIVLDLKEVIRVNSIGLGMFTSAYKAVKQANGRLVLSNITSVESLLSMTKLINIFDIYDDTKSALDSFDSIRTS